MSGMMETWKSSTLGEQRRRELQRRGDHLPLTRENGLGPCQVRSETENPCTYPAVARIFGVPFCERCTQEQEAYFVIGELTQPRTLDEGLLAKALEDLGRERRRGRKFGASEARNATRGRRAVLGAR